MFNKRVSTDSNGSKVLNSGPVLNEELIGQLIGPGGRFQTLLALFLCLLIAPFAAFNNMSQFLILLEPEYRCLTVPTSQLLVDNLQDGSTMTVNFFDNASDVVSVEATPLKNRNILSIHMQLQRECSRPVALVTSPNSSTGCEHGYEYIYEFVYPTVVSENDWICGAEGPKYLSHSAYWAGSVFGVLVIGALSDSFGRIPAIVLSHLVAAAAGVLSPYVARNVGLFMTARFFAGFVMLSQGSIAYVLTMEYIETNKRAMVSNLFLLMWAMVAGLLPWVAYAIADWEMLSLITSLPLLVVPFLVYFIPESIKWQISRQRLDEAKLNVRRVAKLNGTSLNEKDIERLRCAQLSALDALPSAPLSDIIKYGRFLQIFLLTNCLWLLQNMAYTGGNIYAAMATENPYLMLTINSAVDVFAALLSNHFAEALGRKRCTLISSCLAGALYASIIAVPSHRHAIELGLIMTGRLMLTVGYNTQYLYAAEVYPTEVRSTALAIRQSIGSLGNLVAPQIVALNTVLKSLPLVIFGVASLGSAALMVLLPESKGRPLPQTLMDGDNFGLDDVEVVVLSRSKTDDELDEAAMARNRNSFAN